MYYPIQIPQILSPVFKKTTCYQEEIISELSAFIICYWEMFPLTTTPTANQNAIIMDGCIDLVIDFDQQIIGFSGMKHTKIYVEKNFSGFSMGLRLMPGAFQQWTKLSAEKAMDHFLPIAETTLSFDSATFFSNSFSDAKKQLFQFTKQSFQEKEPDFYTRLFNELYIDIPQLHQ